MEILSAPRQCFPATRQSAGEIASRSAHIANPSFSRELGGAPRIHAMSPVESHFDRALTNRRRIHPYCGVCRLHHSLVISPGEIHLHRISAQNFQIRNEHCGKIARLWPLSGRLPTLASRPLPGPCPFERPRIRFTRFTHCLLSRL